MKKFSYFSFTILFLLIGSSSNAQILTLEQYLNEVKTKHDGLRAALALGEGARLRADEGALLTFPTIFANVQIADDKKPTANPAFSGNETAFQGYSFGVSEQTNFGLSAKLSYTVNYTRVTGANPAFLPIPSFYEAKPLLELSQSLLKNGFGRETRATRNLLLASARAATHSENYKAKALFAEAEMTYWGLVIAREMVKVQSESLESARKIRDWNAKRTKLELADRSDFLQAEAGYKARALEHQIAVDESSNLERQFNQLRGSEDAKVAEELQSIDRKGLETVEMPEKKGIREDVLAALALRNVAVANGELGKEKNLPSLDLLGTVALNGRSDQFGNATADSLKTQFPTVGLGLKFSTSLDFGTLGDNREGYLREIQGAELQYRRKQFEEAQDWKTLTVRLAEAKHRLQLANAIESAQSAKIKNERQRLRRGRSVTYQVLLFEQDFANAQSLRLRTEGEILRIVTQMKLFGVETK